QAASGISSAARAAGRGGREPARGGGVERRAGRGVEVREKREPFGDARRGDGGGAAVGGREGGPHGGAVRRACVRWPERAAVPDRRGGAVRRVDGSQTAGITGGPRCSRGSSTARRRCRTGVLGSTGRVGPGSGSGGRERPRGGRASTASTAPTRPAQRSRMLSPRCSSTVVTIPATRCHSSICR